MNGIACCEVRGACGSSRDARASTTRDRTRFAIRSIVASLVLCVSALASPAHGQSSGTLAPRTPADSAYLRAVSRVAAGDTAVDFTPIRRLYASTTFYAPYDAEFDSLRTVLLQSLNAGDFARARALGDGLLARNYLDPGAQLGMAVAVHELGDTLAAARHAAIVGGLVRSMQSTGDGRSAAHPLFVLSPAEEYAFLMATGLQRSGSQGLERCGAGECDAMEVKARSGGAPFTMWFDVTLATAWLERSMKK